ncbi:hypothetical protein [Pseudomonas sp.]|uniref:hypothetical protein n=1 Tax=Pseudomonas sp. TaxID=306 RepID=UPI003CC6A099
MIQAGGAVNVTTQNNFDSSVVRAGYNYVGAGTRTDTTAAGTAYSTRVSLNAQLPPDLAQKEVDPLSLPGFSLPTGQNGLFRLSGASTTSAPVNTGNWTLSGTNLTTSQHQAGTSTRQAPSVQAGASSTGTLTAATVGKIRHTMQNLVPEVLVPRKSVYLKKNTPQNDFLMRRWTE